MGKDERDASSDATMPPAEDTGDKDSYVEETQRLEDDIAAGEDNKAGLTHFFFLVLRPFLLSRIRFRSWGFVSRGVAWGARPFQLGQRSSQEYGSGGGVERDGKEEWNCGCESNVDATCHVVVNSRGDHSYPGAGEEASDEVFNETNRCEESNSCGTKEGAGGA